MLKSAFKIRVRPVGVTPIPTVASNLAPRKASALLLKKLVKPGPASIRTTAEVRTNLPIVARMRNMGSVRGPSNPTKTRTVCRVRIWIGEKSRRLLSDAYSLRRFLPLCSLVCTHFLRLEKLINKMMERVKRKRMGIINKEIKDRQTRKIVRQIKTREKDLSTRMIEAGAIINKFWTIKTYNDQIQNHA